MGEHGWTFKPAVQQPEPTVTPGKWTDTVLGLEVEVEVTTYVRWTAKGFLDDLEVKANGYDWRGPTPERIEQAKAAAVPAAKRLYMAGVRGEKGKTPSLNYHVRPEGSGWAVTGIADQIEAIYPTEDEAWENAAAMAWLTEGGEQAKAALARLESPPPVEADPVLAATGEEEAEPTPLEIAGALIEREERREAEASEQGGEEDR